MLKWVEALESGQYLQGIASNYERKPDGREFYCCLGVACRVAADSGVDAGNWGVAGVLTIPVRDWLGVNRLDPVVGTQTTVNGGCTCPDCKNGQPLHATRANDFERLPFAEIARLIREYYDLGAKPDVGAAE